LTRRVVLAAVLAAALATLILVQGAGARTDAKSSAATASGCQLKSARGNIKHVIYIQFDNTHFRRDNPNVPSDLEQMPNLLHFMQNNGTLLTNDHTVLISHTAGGILSSLTGVYPDRHGQIVSNSNVRFNGTGFSFPSSFGYWTDPIVAGGPPNMVTETGANAPAPWVPYTQAGCDFGAVATANTVLENGNAVFVNGGPTPLQVAVNPGDTVLKVGSVSGFGVGRAVNIGGADPETGTIATIASDVPGGGPRLTLTAGLTKAHPAGVNVWGTTSTNTIGDITKVFGENSPQWNEAKFSQTSLAGTADRNLAQTNFVGFAVHCALGSTTCANGQDDQLPQEPNGYANYKGLFGAQEINPLLGGAALKDLDGNTIADPFGQPGFPGFDGMSASVSLSYVEKMQLAGIPVTFAYISDAHDFHGVAGSQHVAFGPGSQGYVDQLRSYDQAFGKFFTDLAANGIDKSNTLFVFTVDEGDHFAGVTKTNCDGVNTPCVYGDNQVGEINANIDTLFNDQAPDVSVSGHTSSGAPIFNFTVHGDDAPTFYLSGNPSETSTPVRNFERAAANLTAENPYTGETAHRLMVAMADREEMKALHMYTAGDPLRDPTFAYFADPDYFLTDFPTNTCKTCINPLFAWNHGDIQPEIANTWLGFVGPGVKNAGIDAQTWSDHTDVRPTMLRLLGLQSSYVNDGNVLLEPLLPWALPDSLQNHRGTIMRLAAAYKQLNAPFGKFAMDTLTAATAALQTGTAASDDAYTTFDHNLSDLRGQRDTLAAQIRDALNAAAFGGAAIDEHQAQDWIDQANGLISRAGSLGP
jgi:hypothetical protein